MAGINPVGGPNLPMPAPGSTRAAQAGGADATSFGQTLRSCLERVDADQKATAFAIQDLLTGKSQDILPVVTAVAEADLSFKLLMGVRNKVIEAYKQTLNMQM